MTERPEGTPEAVPAEPEATADPRTETDATEAVDAMTEPLGDAAEAIEPAAGAADQPTAGIDKADVDVIDELEADEAEEAEADDVDAGDEDEFEDETIEPLPGEPAVAAGTAAAPSVPRRRGAAPVVQRAPTQSELAVRVTDNYSRFFVIGTVVVFVAILAWGLLGGTGGLLTPLPTPPPAVSAEPSPSASGSAASPSESPAPTVSIEAPSPS